MQLESDLIVELGQKTHTKDIFFTSNNNHADLSTNALFILSKHMKKSPKDIFEQIKTKINNKYIKDITMSKNGFLNFHLHDNFLHDGLKNIIDDKNTFEKNNIKVNVEFVSANPTGPLHYGNARSVYGDSLANILRFAGYNTTKEYYVNDAGNQINILADSVFSEYLKLQNLPSLELEEQYKGSYISDIAQEIYKNDSEKWDKNNYKEHFKSFSMKYIIEIIKEDLLSVGIKHDEWVFESDIICKVSEAFEILRNKDLIYEGKLGTIHSKKGEESHQTLTLFRSSKFEDSEDRALTKPDGSNTYFANDIGYFYDKIKRDFKWMIVVLGADHDGYIKRLQNAVLNLADDIKLDIKTCQVVLFKQNGENIKISKRSGNALGLREAVEGIGKDMFRFLMLSKSLDTHYTVNTDQIVELSMENPFYYLQYAHARIHSMFNAHNKELDFNFSLDSLTESMCSLLKILLDFRKCIKSITRTLEVHKMTHYLTSIAEKFHSIWNEGKMDPEKRWILQQNEKYTNDRMVLAHSVKKTITQAMNLLGIKPYDSL
ncbi:arginine--tRNA ligase [Candidatus Cytomitobacter indipagum]|nr:arginine--tRNA ligase [Candidatus Cytomitobacter indipagum]